MKNEINLYLETGNGNISIPFDSIKDVDTFTMRYNNRLEFLDSIIKIFELPMYIQDFGKIYIKYRAIENDCFNYDDCLPVRYGVDNYNVDSLINGYALYLKQDQKRLSGYGVRNVVDKLVTNFVPGMVEEKTIDLVAKVYLGDNYRKIRDVYFQIRDDVYINIDKLPLKMRKITRNKLYQLNSSEDDYLQYLIELASRGTKEFEVAMEELSLMDLDEIKKRLDKMYYGVLDGLSSLELADPDDIYSLEELSGLNIELLKKKCCKQLGYGRMR